MIKRLSKWLDNHSIEYFTSKSGLISVTVNDIPKELVSEYNQLCYELQRA